MTPPVTPLDLGRWLTTLGLCVSLAACGGGSSSSTSTTPTPGGGGSTPSTSSFFQTAVSTTGAHPASSVLERAQASQASRTPTVTEFFNWAQTAFPAVFPAASASANQTWGAYTYRTYGTLALAVHSDGTAFAISQITSTTPLSLTLGQLSQYTCAVFPTECHSTTAAVPLAQRAGALAGMLGKNRRFLVGLGTTTVAHIQAQSIQPDIWDNYLVAASASGDWRAWNSPDGTYVNVAAANADALGAIPMFTLYQMATWGDGNLWSLADTPFMTRYWDNVRVMFQRIKVYGKPTLVNLEPDFWGYAHRISADPAQHFAHVANVNADCSSQPNTVAGFAGCLVQMARTLAPNAYVGFPPSMFGDLVGNELNYMRAVGAGNADFIVMQTQDRDAGCYEAQYTGNGATCNRSQTNPWYWDDTNTASASTFSQHFAVVRNLHQGLGLPVLWWQTPLGVPSATPGGSVNAFRDNRTQYFLTKTSELVAAGGVGAVFSPGHVTQTNITTDGGQFRRLSSAYLASPAALR